MKTNTQVRRHAAATRAANQSQTKTARATARNGHTVKTQVEPPVTLVFYLDKKDAPIGNLEVSAEFYRRIKAGARRLGVSVGEFINQAVSAAGVGAFLGKDGAR